MNIAKWDSDEEDAIMDVATWAADKTNFSDVPFKALQNPSNGWSMPFVTNKRYRVWWGSDIDFTEMTV